MNGPVPDPWSLLSGREVQVAQLAAEGLTNKEIGARLPLNVATVKTHMRRVFTKLHVRNRTELAARLVAKNAVAQNSAAAASRAEQVAALVVKLRETSLDDGQRQLVDQLQRLVGAGRSS